MGLGSPIGAGGNGFSAQGAAGSAEKMGSELFATPLLPCRISAKVVR